MAKKTIDRHAPFDLQAGRQIGSHYEVLRKLGEGSEGEVYQIADRATGIHRAAKLYYRADDRKNPAVVWHARKLEKLRTCSIVLQYHHTETIQIRRRGVLCLISEFCRGIPLEDWLRQQPGGRLQPFTALHLLRALALGLEEIHAVREYHGDVHTQNIMVEQVGVHFHLRLIDFFNWGRPTREKKEQDIVDAIKVFHECLGGAARYRHLPKEPRYICAGLKRTLLLKRFPSMAALRAHLDTFRWESTR